MISMNQIRVFLESLTNKLINMKQTFTSFFVALFLMGSIIAQDCPMYFIPEEGKVIELTHYDKKDKVTGITEQEVIEKESTPEGMSLKIGSTMKDKKGEEIGTSEFIVKCENGVYYFDMNNYLSGESMEAYKDMNFTVESDAIEIPANPQPGDELKGGSVQVKVEGMDMMNMNMSVSDRKVEAIEDITTPAGTFKCVKITYNFKSKVAFVNVQGSGVDWISKDLGSVRTESYAKNGKLTGYTELTAIK